LETKKEYTIRKIALLEVDRKTIYTMNPDGSGVFKVTNFVPIAGFNPDFINFLGTLQAVRLSIPILINYIR
jgi:hypothetical protein